jgi:phenylalanyl-tRNA synthetase beta chain
MVQSPIPADDRKLADDLTLAGVAVESVTEHDGQAIYEMEITTNRVDAMNHYGIARECSAIYDLDLKALQPSLPQEKGNPAFHIDIAEAQLCARYTAQVVRNVKIGISLPPVLKRFAELEQKPINNAADATNYTLLEMGHPTHAFDLDRLDGGKIVVRLARAGEVLKTLDGVERKLHPEDLVIADATKPVALAGVMGGFDSMITESTRNVLIESAWFDPASIRRTARRHGMHTDASHRFERGADWGVAPVACARVAELILRSGGELEGGQIDAIAREVGHPAVGLRRAEVLRILGQEIPAPELERILRRLGFRLIPAKSIATSAKGTGGAAAALVEEPADYQVQIPTWRLDVEREIDLIEELARVHGFNRFADTLPAFAGGVSESPTAVREAKVRSVLLALGYNEAVSSSFVSHDEAKEFSTDAIIEVANPLSEEASVMRTSLLPGMLAMLARNLNRGNDDVRLFEMGHVFSLAGNRWDERRSLAIGATGTAEIAGVHALNRPYGFFDLKGDLEQLLNQFECTNLYFDRHAGELYHPGRSARAVMNGATVARFGQLHPEVAAARKLRQDVFVAEIALDRLLQQPLRSPRYEKLSRFPAVERDFSFLFPDEVTFERLEQATEALRIAEMKALRPVEIFRGGNVPRGQYSLLLRISFQSLERTLTEEDVAGWTEQIVNALKALGGVQRA